MSRLLGPASALLSAAWLAGVSAAGETFHWKDDEQRGVADLFYGDQPVLRYMYAYDDSTAERREETYKPYHHVFGPGSGQIITKGPGGLYPHHRGLYVAWNKTQADGKSFDFWHCTNGVHQRHVEFVEMTGDAKSGAMTARIHWNDAADQPVVAETRTVAVSRPEGLDRPAWQIDWRTKLESRRGEITLDGDRQHAGFQFRAAQVVAEEKSARYIRPAGFPEQPQAFEVNDRTDADGHVNLGWLAMTCPLAGRQYTIEYFEDPALPRPSRYSERPYGRFGAFFKTTLAPEEPLEMRYRLVVSTGEPPSRRAIQRRYERFAAEVGAK
ncbi:MAG TPA: DUF6807 family protein [Planctomycetaceae bacterium]|nr:DUF6807 family protein [Planctomycetaceae bacterium]